jgi:hypothetical protein
LKARSRIPVKAKRIPRRWFGTGTEASQRDVPDARSGYSGT